MALPFKILAAILLACLAPTVAFAEAPGSPKNLRALDRLIAQRGHGKFVLVDDMLIPRGWLRTYRLALTHGSRKRATATTTAPIWTGGVVYYSFDASVSAIHQRAFVAACTDWATWANLTFVPRTTQPNYIVVLDGGPSFIGGQSAVGMVGGAQNLTIGSAAWNRTTLVHELGHALGFKHEHQRPDRDNYVTILTANIQTGKEGNFTLLTSANMLRPYDFLSIMHYDRNSWSIDSATLNTIEPKPAYSQYLDIMGDNYPRHFSVDDRASIAQLYGPPPVLPGAVVTNTNDSGSGSLRAAIYYAADNPGTTITFQIPTSDPGYSGGVFSIRALDRLPGLPNNTTLDGTSQTAFTGDTNASGPEIEITGVVSPATDVTYEGMILDDANCVLKGVVVNGFGRSGIAMNMPTAHGNVVSGCYVGTDATGTTSVPNGYSGIGIWNGAYGNTIGGTTAADRNVISGNTEHGMIFDSGATGNVIQGNTIGLNVAATALPNGYRGIYFRGGAFSNSVLGNVISGNTQQGVGIYNIGTDGNVIRGNFLGTNPAGSAAIPNQLNGIAIWGGAKGTIIGGTSVGDGNVISGNSSSGICIEDAGTENTAVQGNLIGLNAAGTAALANGGSGVYLYGSSANNIIGPGNILSGNTANGVIIDGADSNVVRGNFIGLNAAGTAAVPNAQRGVYMRVGATGNTIGGTTATDRNVISGNTWQGVGIFGAGADGNVVQGNYIGTNPAGTAAIPNELNGVIIFSNPPSVPGPQNNVIGGTIAGARNVISGNLSHGLLIRDTGTNANSVVGNFIGLNAAGTAAVGNATTGVYIFNGVTNTVIGPGNFISGNGNNGVLVQTAGTTGTVVKGNWIGVSITGATVTNVFSGVLVFGGATGTLIGGGPGSGNVISGNTLSGIRISDAGTNNTIIKGNLIGLNPVTGAAAPNQSTGITVWSGAQSMEIGGTSPGDANIIRGNTAEGIFVRDSGTKFINIQGNSIDGNTATGIRLNNSANELIAPPTLTSAVAGNGLAVQGTLTGTANAVYRLDVYASPSGDSSGFGEGLAYLGSTNVTMSAGGSASFTFTNPASPGVGTIVSATSTNPTGSTSSFAGNRTVTTTDSDGDGLPDAWESAHGLNPLVGNSTSDSDSDGLTDRQEYLAGSDPLDPTSKLRAAATTGSGGDFSIDVATVQGKTYRIEKRSSLSTPWMPWVESVAGTGGTVRVTDPSAMSQTAQSFYRAIVVP